MQSEELMLLDTPRTIREAFRQASSFLQEAGVESAEFEAEYLLRRLLQLDRTSFFVRMPESFPSASFPKLNEWLERRKKQEPIQYIVGDQEFFGRTFHVSPAVLIPRPETELLVERVLQEAECWCQREQIRAVDVGSGSGCISITLASERPKWEITAVDLSSDALRMAKYNADSLEVRDRIQFLQGSFLEPVEGPFDVLVSNPPYISQSDLLQLESQVKDYEPSLALDGGVDGLAPYRELVSQLSQKKNLPKRLLVAFEIGADQGEAVAREVQKLPGFVRVEVEQDFAARDRIVLAWLDR
ncbi:peptide chain release factor N(5)-glutamine methyltransferase [Risungbinella massiliensis]|uniref:peptide chain release factor N(5)-glutamine methyltransferase n=1 Tax=Risungbinella massiliensis TaxID=1329796 RepID=UPI0005CB8F10|nr:peptide chain release factor N(5)-glutamine methyltransferase [Risungbinella massiliensis]